MGKKYTEKRPWGKFERYTLNEISTVKIITVKPGQRLSLQKHKHRREFWRILDGNAKVTVGNSSVRKKKGDEISIGKGQKHRIEALSDGCVFMEIAYGKFDEKDNIRLEDDYGRVKKK